LKHRGTFVFSLDYELYWGVWDSQDHNYIEQLSRVNTEVIPRLLALTQKYNIRLTFATVGSLMCKNFVEWQELIQIKKYQLSYINEGLNILKNTNLQSQKPDVLFAHDLVLTISKEKMHEIASHTFGHIYCNEVGLKIEECSKDFNLFKRKYQGLFGSQPFSIVFPRNQYNTKVLELSKDFGVRVYRGNEPTWIYRTSDRKTYRNKFKRVLRFFDTYLNIAGNNTPIPSIDWDLINIPSSRFFRPFNEKLALLESIKLRRIFNQMAHAAKVDGVFHLWCHPHNLIQHQDVVFAQLEEIFKRADKLNLESLTMYDCAQKYYPNKF